MAGSPRRRATSVALILCVVALAEGLQLSGSDETEGRLRHNLKSSRTSPTGFVAAAAAEAPERTAIVQDLHAEAASVHAKGAETAAAATGDARSGAEAAAQVRHGHKHIPGEGAFLWVTDTTMYIIGTAMVLLAVLGLWFFERQRARVECLLETAQATCVSAHGGKVDPGNFGQLVHLTGETARATGTIEDPRFNCAALGLNCLRLRSEVQVFQWVERPAGGGSPEKATSGAVEYVQVWSEAEHRSQRYRDKTKENTKPARLSVGRDTTNASQVEYGAFVLPPGLVDQIQSFRPVGKLLGDKVETRDGLHTFQRHVDDFFYYRPGNGGQWTAEEVARSPQIGDARARFECVSAAAATVLALQAESDATAGGLLLPYRLVPQGTLCCSSQTDRAALVAEGRKTRDQLARENQCLAGSRLCCGCNVVAGCCAGALTPEVFRCFEGTKSIEQCFVEVALTSTTSISFRTWTARAIAWFALFMGLMMAYSQVIWHRPLSSLPVVELLGNFARPGACMLVTFAVSSLMISFAYMAFRPLTSFLWLVLAVCSCVLPNMMPPSPAGAGASFLMQPGPVSLLSHAANPHAAFALKRRLTQQSHLKENRVRVGQL